MKNRRFNFKKSALFGWITILIWLVLIAVYIYFPIRLTIRHYGFSVILLALLIINGVFVSYYLISGVKDIIVFAVYELMKKPELHAEKRIVATPLPHDWHPKVLLLYTTCNDFIPSALSQSMKQDYSNVQTVILDDSRKKPYIRKVDAFKATHPEVKLVRRKAHYGFKAGNINHFLRNYHNYDYFVILDSDEVIPEDFVSKALHYFAFDPKMGILQCTHNSDRNQNWFMSEFSRSSTTFWKVYNTFKLKYGFSAMYGHGAMVSRQDYETTPCGFPQIVAEDISFSLESEFKGFRIGFSNLILCHEEFPINYLAFKKRQMKWVSGNWQLIMDYTRKIMHTRQIHWYEKLDLFIFVYSLSIYALMYCSVIICSVILPTMGVMIRYVSLWTLIPIIWFYLAQTINDAMVQIKIGYPVRKLPLYILNSMVLYGSMYWVNVRTTLKMMLGDKAKFIVTPKNNSRYSFRRAFNYNHNEVAFGLINIIIIITFCGVSLLSIMMMMTFFPGMISPYLIPISNLQSRKNREVVAKLDNGVYYDHRPITKESMFD